MRLAYFTPLRPSKSGIADHNSQLLPHLAKGGEPAWVLKTGEEVTIRLRVEADDDYPEPVFAVDTYRFDGVFVGSVNNVDMRPTTLPVKKGVNTLDLRLPALDLPYNAYFLSLKAYTEDGRPDWRDPADIHNQMYQFDVVTDRLIHGLMRFDAEWGRKV
jgi:hypothetical protein